MEKILVLSLTFDHAACGSRKTAADLHEAEALAVSCRGIRIVASRIIPVRRPTAALLIGKGKAAEMHDLVHEVDADCVVFDEDLTPRQQRNLEEVLGVKTIDRTQLILDIFARRAHSKEGKIQIEAAQLSYVLPRLFGQGVYLSRLGGGIGTRGPGEQKLEVDRRRIRYRMSRLKKELEQLRRRRRRLRKNRKDKLLPTAVLVGYTSAGKSTLLNAFTASGAHSYKGLFSTLDPMSRLYTLPNNQRVLLTDTVGFIKRLPHHVVESFHATLEEVQAADIIIHVLDAHADDCNEKYEAVLDVLADLKVTDKPIITVLNKVDRIIDGARIKKLERWYAGAVNISALKKTGLKGIDQALDHQLSQLRREMRLFIPYDKMDLIHRIYKDGIVLSRTDTEQGVFLQGALNVTLSSMVAAYECDDIPDQDPA